MPRKQARVGSTKGVLVFVLYKADRLETTADHDVDVVTNNGFSRQRNRHHAGRTLSVDRQSGRSDRQASSECNLPTNILPLRALRHRTTHHDIVDFRGVQSGAFHRMANRS